MSIWIYSGNFGITVVDAAHLVHYPTRKHDPEQILPLAEARVQP